MAEVLTCVAAKRIRNEDADILTNPSDVDFVRQRGGVKGQNQQARIASLTISESREPADVCHAVSSQISQDLILSHVAEFGGENGALARVATLVEGNSDLFVAESGRLQESLRVSARVGFQNQRAVCQCLDVNIARAADS